MEVPKNEGAILNKGRAFIEYGSINEAKKVLNYSIIESNFLRRSKLMGTG